MAKYFITTGCGNSTYELNAFDNALLSSGIADYNLVKLSSILPAECIQVNSVDLSKGSFLHTAYSSFIENQPGRTISAAIAIAIPRDKSAPGVIMETAGEYDIVTADSIVTVMVQIAMQARGISEYDVQKDSTSMMTKQGCNCVIAAVSIW